MKNLIKKYFEMDDNERENIERLYIIDTIENELIDIHDELDISDEDEEILIKLVEDLLTFANISLYDLVDRILTLVEAPDMSAKDINILGTDELIELLSENENDFNNPCSDSELLKEFDYKNSKCSFSKNGNLYVIICEKDDEAHIMLYKDFDDILRDVVEYNLLKGPDTIE